MAPANWIPSYAIYLGETDQRPFVWALGSLKDALDVAQKHGVRRFVIRRSKWTIMGERPNGMIVYTKN
jgi:hypothetical protein